MTQDKMEVFAPGISFYKDRGEIRIHHSTILALGDPYFIRFLLNTDKGCLAIQRVEKKEKDSFTVPEYKAENWVFRIYSERMIEILWKQFNWDKEKTYRCCGVLYPQNSLVEFDLKKAEIILTADAK